MWILQAWASYPNQKNQNFKIERKFSSSRAMTKEYVVGALKVNYFYKEKPPVGLLLVNSWYEKLFQCPCIFF